MILIPAGENTELVGMYVSDRTGCVFTPGMYQALAVINDSGRFCAGIVVSDYREYDCQISCACETSMAWRKNVIRGFFDYIFNQLGCKRCTCITKKTNKRTRAFLEGLGFQLEGRMRCGFDGIKDALVYGLLASECVYIQPEPSDNNDGNADHNTATSDGEYLIN